jgi:hypothetical protein
MSKYRDYVRSLPCCVTGYIGDEVDPHHIKGYAWLTGGSMGKKSSDLSCIPLKHDLHQELHDIGWKSFEEKYSFSQSDWMLRTIFRAEKDGIIKL